MLLAVLWGPWAVARRGGTPLLRELLQYSSRGVVLVVAAALTRVLAVQVGLCNTYCATTAEFQAFELGESTRCPSCPFYTPREPATGCCAGLNLPGPDPGQIDLDAVSSLIITGKATISDAAAQLGTSTGHIRFALERVSRPARDWGPGALPAAWRRQQRARTVLTREFFDREYLQAGKTLRDLETETGLPRKFLAAAAREHGITLASSSSPAPINGDWLREQYQTRHRSYSGIAAELGVRPEPMIAAARRHHIPSRPFTVHSRPEMTTRFETAIWARCGCQGRSPDGAIGTVDELIAAIGFASAAVRTPVCRRVERRVITLRGTRTMQTHYHLPFLWQGTPVRTARTK